MSDVRTLDTAITQALTESSGQDTRTCTCHPDDNPPVPCPQKFALSECRKSSGQGTDGAGAMREAAAKIAETYRVDLEFCRTQLEAARQYGGDIAKAIRALPLPVSADGRDAVIEECAKQADEYGKKVQSGHWLSAARSIAERIRLLKSKQPSDTEKSK